MPNSYAFCDEPISDSNLSTTPNQGLDDNWADDAQDMDVCFRPFTFFCSDLFILNSFLFSIFSFL